MNKLVFLEPVFKEMIWGGSRLKDYGYKIPSNKTGECWGISAHENGDCFVSKGKYKGMKLSQLWENHRELFGNIAGDKFPLLVKIIDATDDLSIQVHPDDDYAKLHENNSFGKTESWYILDCNAEADIIIGHNAKTKEELIQLIDTHRWEQLVRTVPIKKGDFFQINPGTLHSIKKGTLVLEIQQSSDITYRVYDYDRLLNGKKRALHRKQSLDVITIPYMESESHHVLTDIDYQPLVSNNFYSIVKLNITKPVNYKQDRPFQLMCVIDGSGSINHIPIKKGEHFILPFQYGDYILDGNMCIISSFV